VRISGRAASPGSRRGIARKVSGSAPPADAIAPGDILVVPFSTPLYYDLFLRASAVVAEVGGVTSHAAGLARELGLPCVVAATGAMNLIADGATITVDGDAGVVHA
jgi:phosphohistidine swiveling domain-containing protein